MCVWVCQTLLDIVCVERANTCFGRLHVPEPAKPELWKLGGSRFSLAFYRSSPLTISGSLPVFVFFCSCSFSLSASFSVPFNLSLSIFSLLCSFCRFSFSLFLSLSLVLSFVWNCSLYISLYRSRSYSLSQALPFSHGYSFCSLPRSCFVPLLLCFFISLFASRPFSFSLVFDFPHCALSLFISPHKSI